MKPATKRLIAAVILAPLPLGIMAGIVGYFAGQWTMAGYFFLGVTVFTILAMIILGLPMHFILKRLGRTGFFAYMFGAALAGVLISVLNTSFVGLQISLNEFPKGLVSHLTFIVASMLTAGIAWAIARPDKG